MTSGHNGSGVDGNAYIDVTDLAHRTPSWLNDAIGAWSLYGLSLFAVLMLAAWWGARRAGSPSAVTALAVPLVTLAGFGVDLLLKLVFREDRPCQSLHVAVLESCPAPGDWSFPSNHAAIAAAAAVALLFVSRRLGGVAVVAAVLMAASRVWVGVHYPHDVLAGLLVGALVAAVCGRAVQRRQSVLADRLGEGRLRPLLTAP
ncbi:phosphatase PAP2 family protein [Streptomyces lavendulae]|uniref:Undecaprenyl-diphosphatase BcrC n=1 Tax=Streptomyces lavendulae subsp. lavendulae TaxID=58340 RepID=A0A2K8P8B8_STRLA|nr:phosphatase PAP2 family protein [Streptomyces lavendulae]ATZ22992.1 Undecaprenyl-diphosphatase BcrC [Streptomyces lavendulae subsp. lavendulae]QUQ52833.1 Undecaprenyl-diphosphatase BcrC [Streptomyces lavendulae subsp. lavendulae]